MPGTEPLEEGKKIAKKKPVKKTAEKQPTARDIGVDVKAPERSCNDPRCPFHGTLPVRGQKIEGVVSSTKMDKTIVVRRQYLNYVPKYERYEKRSGRYQAHRPPCIDLNVGDDVTIMECRPISKAVSFVVIERR